MRIYLFLAPLGALIACAEGTGTDELGSYTEKGPVDEDWQHEQDIEALRGDYASCSDALVGLGFTPWTSYVEEETAEIFEVPDPDDEVNPRPWVATLSFVDEDPGYHVTCTELDGSPHMWVDPGLDEYWTCAFQADFIGILDPESDPQCSEGLSQAYRLDSVDEEVYEYELDGPGRFVAQE